MNRTEKPFVCSEKDCEMTFTNEDHLNCHQKKHDMMLNLGLAKNDVADQTPTPTRFIRNCEEVGLFQDLQNVCNVNPFDEFFKKAIELARNGVTLEVPETNSDDTLHTPHILPHVEENRKRNSEGKNENHDSTEFSLNVVSPKSTSDQKECDSTSFVIVIDDDESSNGKDIKNRIKKVLQSKEKQRMEKENHTHETDSALFVEQPQNLMEKNEKTATAYANKKDVIILESREKVREMNRAAQVRCRKRKQIRWKEMENEILLLKAENKRLRIENHNLKCQLMEINKNTDRNEGNKKVPAGSVTLPVLPNIFPKLDNSSNAIVIQFLPNGSAAVPLTNNRNTPPLKIENVYSVSETPSVYNRDGTQNEMKKSLRKIIPKIIKY